MAESYTHEFSTPLFKGKVTVPLGSLIDGKFVKGSSGKTIECVSSVSDHLLDLLCSLHIPISFSVINPGTPSSHPTMPASHSSLLPSQRQSHHRRT